MTAKQVISCNLYPYSNSLQQPTISHNGKYVLRLFFNGCSRKVVIDDRLPASRTSRKLHVVDRNHPTLLWPALVEKAYLKIRGGYNFPGSNSGTDLHVLTGWIPEQLFLQRCAYATLTYIFILFSNIGILTGLATTYHGVPSGGEFSMPSTMATCSLRWVQVN